MIGRLVQVSTCTDETDRHRTYPIASQAFRRCPMRWLAAIWTNRRRLVWRVVAVLHSDEKSHRTSIYMCVCVCVCVCINVYNFLFLCFSRLKKTQKSHENKCKEHEEEENGAGLKDRFSFFLFLFSSYIYIYIYIFQ